MLVVKRFASAGVKQAKNGVKAQNALTRLAAGKSIQKCVKAGMTRLELAASAVTGQRSNQLSYTRKKKLSGGRIYV